MKNNKIPMPHYVSLFLALFLAGNIIFLVSCNKDEPSTGVPVIEKVKLINKDSTAALSGAIPGTLVVIQGQNLGSVTKVYFNEYVATFNSAYNTDNNLVITIPADAPTEATVSTVTSTIRLVTTHGETTYNFTLYPPPATILSVSNEFANAGELMVITGKDMYNVQKVIFPDAIEVTDFTITGSTMCSVIVPANVGVGPVKIQSKSGIGTSYLTLNDTTGIIINFDNVNTYSYWGMGSDGIISDATNFPGARGSFANMHAASLPAPSPDWWNDNGRDLNTSSVVWLDSTLFNQPMAKYAIKFEFFANGPWSGGTLFLDKDFSFKYMYRFEPWKVGADVVPVTSTTWQTMVVPLTGFLSSSGGVNGVGSPAASLAILLGNGKGAFNMYLMNDGTEPATNISVGIDNVRLVRIAE